MRAICVTMYYKILYRLQNIMLNGAVGIYWFSGCNTFVKISYYDMFFQYWFIGKYAQAQNVGSSLRFLTLNIQAKMTEMFL